MKEVIIGIDAGTSVIKAVAFTSTGEQLGVASKKNKYQHLDNGGVEQDMLLTWKKTVEAVKTLGEKIENLEQRTIAVAVTGQGDGTWMIDRDGEPVQDAWLWLDGRAGALVEEIRNEDRDQERFNLNGVGLAACQQGPQLIFMERNQPEIIRGSRYAFHCKDWLYYKMTDVVATDPSEAVMSFGNLMTRDYDDLVVEMLGLKKDSIGLLPPIVDGAITHHPLTQEASTALGLRVGTPVVLSYVDVLCTAIGSGIYQKNTTSVGCSVVGSTGMHLKLVESFDALTFNRSKTGYIFVAPEKGVFFQAQSNMSMTLNIDWLCQLIDELFQTQNIQKSSKQLIEILDGFLKKANPAQILYHPYISEAGERGPFLSADARASFIGLQQQHRFSDLVYSVFEGLAFSVRHCYEFMGDIPKELRLSGGAANSFYMRKILALVTQASIRMTQREEAGAAGASMIAGLSLGLYSSLEECSKEWALALLGEKESYTCDYLERYEDLYRQYLVAQEKLLSIWK